MNPYEAVAAEAATRRIKELEVRLQEVTDQRDKCKQQLIVLSGQLNRMRADIDGVVWPSCGFASGAPL